MERLDEEFIKVLKSCDAHSHEYVERLKDEPEVMEVLEMAQKLIDRVGSPSEMCRIYLKRIEHVYFKFDTRVIRHKHVSIFQGVFFLLFHVLNDELVSCSFELLALITKYDNTDKFLSGKGFCFLIVFLFHAFLFLIF